MQLQLTLSKLFKSFIENRNNPKAVMMELIELVLFFLIFLFIYKSPRQINLF